MAPEALAHVLRPLANTFAAADFPDLLVGLGAPDDAAGDKPGYIDAHVHVWTPDVERWPLAEGFSPERMNPPSFTPEELLALARPAGVSRIVLMGQRNGGHAEGP